MSSTKLKPAVAYIRMSSGKQEASPDQQRAEVAKLAKRHKCRILREYFDEAISGDATEKRTDFKQMIQDAEEIGDFCVILTYDQDRFGRFDSIEAGRWIYPLRKAGVWMLTVVQGQIDWNDFQSRLVYSVAQEGKYQFVLDRSRLSLRGKLNTVNRGGTCTRPPYGYDRVYSDEKGDFVRRVPYGDKFTKPREWTVTYAPSEDPEIVETVRWMFDTFADSDCSMAWLIRALNDRKPPKMPKRGWSERGVKYMLENPTYTGARVFGRRRTGKYHQIGDDGELIANPPKQVGEPVRKPPINDPGVYEALIDQETFDRVQQKLAERHQKREKPRHAGYVLSGVLRCGHCGHALTGDNAGVGDGKHQSRYYRCHSKNDDSRRCPSAKVRQVDLEALVIGYIQDKLFKPSVVDDIRRAIHRKARTKDAFRTATKSLKTKITALDKKIDKGTENLLLADPEDMAALSQMLKGWRADRGKLQTQLESTATSPGSRSPEETANRAIAELKRLRERFKSADPVKVRGVVKAMIEEITLWWEPNGKRKRIARGEIVPKAARGVIGSTPRGGPFPSS